MDFSLYLDLHFLLLSISTILLFTWFIVPYFYLAEHLTRHGYTDVEASRVISTIGVTNTIGMVSLSKVILIFKLHVFLITNLLLTYILLCTF